MGMLRPFNTDKDFFSDAQLPAFFAQLSVGYPVYLGFASFHPLSISLFLLLRVQTEGAVSKQAPPHYSNLWLSLLWLNRICSFVQRLAEMCHFLSIDYFSELMQLSPIYSYTNS